MSHRRTSEPVRRLRARCATTRGAGAFFARGGVASSARRVASLALAFALVLLTHAGAQRQAAAQSSALQNAPRQRAVALTGKGLVPALQFYRRP